MDLGPLYVTQTVSVDIYLHIPGARALIIERATVVIPNAVDVHHSTAHRKRREVDVTTDYPSGCAARHATRCDRCVSVCWAMHWATMMVAYASTRLSLSLRNGISTKELLQVVAHQGNGYERNQGT